MIDRCVRQLFPKANSADDNQRWLFSEFKKCPNIILLGDPGAGKSYLFEHCAKSDNGIYLRVRSFLNRPTIGVKGPLYLDALDEKREGRGDRTTVDKIVQKLFVDKPEQVRISCRIVDWLGETDLQEFKDYFDFNGQEYVVLILEAISDDEKHLILESEGISDPNIFLETAVQRGLGKLLDNPQNLLMLANAVKSKGEWPHTKKQLFEAATKNLLLEHANTRSGDRIYNAVELNEAAGAICAVRLISDVEGISLNEKEINSDFPSYRSLGNIFSEIEINKFRAVLGRRVFTSGPVEETVDYAHRTTAEFLAASFISKQIQNGLPITRVQSLIEIDGYPASELRGLYAWLPLFIPNHADVFINADPCGFLVYGDIASLTLDNKKKLVNALNHFAKSDPLFYYDIYSDVDLGSISCPGMEETFRKVLSSRETESVMRLIILNALAVGMPIPGLRDDLKTILFDRKALIAERRCAIKALVKLGGEAREGLVKLYHENLGSAFDDIILRASILLNLYGEEFSSEVIVDLLNDVINCSEGELEHGFLSPITKIISSKKMEEILDTLKIKSSVAGSKHNISIILRVIDCMLLSVLQEKGRDISGKKMWAWLIVRDSLANLSYRTSNNQLKVALIQNSELLKALTNEALDSLIVDGKEGWVLYQLTRDLTFYSISESDLLHQIIERIKNNKDDANKKEFLYEYAVNLSFRINPQALVAFEELCVYSEKSPNFNLIYQQNNFCPLDDGRYQYAREKIERAEEAEKIRSDVIKIFGNHKDAIRNGTNTDWLRRCAGIYFGDFENIDKSMLPSERLIHQLGYENAKIALEGFNTYLRHCDIPSLDSIIDCYVENSFPYLWKVILAGMDEQWSICSDLLSFPPDILISALAIELVFPVSGENSHQTEHGWKTAISQQRPELLHEVYMSVVRGLFTRKADCINGVYELISMKELAPFKQETVADLLQEFPDMKSSELKKLLGAMLNITENKSKFLLMIDQICANLSSISQDNREIWLAAAYLISPDKYESQIKNFVESHPSIIWQLRDLMSYIPNNSNLISIAQLEVIAQMTARRYPKVQRPSGAQWGMANVWDAADFVRLLMNKISTSSSKDATEALERLANDNALSSYHDEVKHILAKQRTNYRNAVYHQPNWEETIETLSNRAPAHVADLQALVLNHLHLLIPFIANSNTDIYKKFWNEDSYGKIVDPKCEDTCRDNLIDLLRPLLQPLGIYSVEPEGHMVENKRTDILVSYNDMKIVIELKRDYHPEVWSSIRDQLDRYYTRDPLCRGYGIFGVFWFGDDKRPQYVPKPPGEEEKPQSADEMEKILNSIIPNDKKHLIKAIVIDVSGPSMNNSHLKCDELTYKI